MAADRSREARLDALLDKEEILDCLRRMSRGSDRFDRELFLSACHPDAVLAAGPFVGSPEELYDWSAQLQASTYRATMHKLLNFTCDIDGDIAHAETYYLFVGCIGAVLNIFWIFSYPLASILMITLNLMVVYALTTYGVDDLQY